MNLDLLTIANRARLGSSILSSINNSRDRIAQIKSIVDKIEASTDFSKKEKKKELEFSIIGVVSILEQHMNDMLYQLYVSFPRCQGTGSWHASALAGGYMAATAMHVHK